MAVESVSHGFIYVFSFIGLVLTPQSLKKIKWLYPLWFFLVNLILFLGVWKFNIQGTPLFFVLLSQLPWIMITAYIITATRQKLITLDTSEWTLWCIYRLMGIHFFFLIYAYTLPQEFIIQTGILEFFTGAGAVIVYIAQRKNWKWAWHLLISWNALGMLSACKLNSQLQTFLYTGPAGPGEREITTYFLHFPEIWQSSFWVPMSISIHFVVFYALWHKRRRQ